MRVARFALLALVVPLVGCITSSTVLTVRADGSGTIEQTTTMTAEAAAQLSKLAAGFGGGSKSGKPPEIFSEAEARAMAAKLGQGVTLVSSEPVKTADAEGTRAVYEFSDITKIRLNQKPSSPAGQAGGLKVGGSEPEEIRFRFARQPGGTSVVTLVFPEVTDEQVKQAQRLRMNQEVDPQMLSMTRLMFKDMRISIVMQVAGRIVKTNSPYVEGSKVTLLDVDFNQLLLDETMVPKIQGIETLEQAKLVFKGVKGVTFNFDREVMVEFAGR